MEFLLLLILFQLCRISNHTDKLSSEFFRTRQILRSVDEKLTKLLQHYGLERKVISNRVSLLLEDYPNHRKNEVLKVVHKITGLGLKDAKELIEKVPCILPKSMTFVDAELTKVKLNYVGAIASIKEEIA